MRNIPRRAAVLLCIAGVAGTFLFSFFMYSPCQLEIKIIPNKVLYRKGEVAHFDFYLICKSSLFFESVTIPSLDYDVKITGPSGPVFATQEFIHRTGPVTLRGNAQLELGKLDWNLCDLRGNLVPAGVYKVSVSLHDWKLSGEISIEITDTSLLQSYSKGHLL